ncbi:hypothetical protein L195_g041305, partial [Trifolium pratense]
SDKVVSNHLFRIHGRENQTIFAELPLGATDADCKGKGYSQCLLACVESFGKHWCPAYGVADNNKSTTYVASAFRIR